MTKEEALEELLRPRTVPWSESDFYSAVICAREALRREVEAEKNRDAMDILCWKCHRPIDFALTDKITWGVTREGHVHASCLFLVDLLPLEQAQQPKRPSLSQQERCVQTVRDCMILHGDREWGDLNVEMHREAQLWLGDVLDSLRILREQIVPHLKLEFTITAQQILRALGEVV